MTRRSSFLALVSLVVPAAARADPPAGAGTTPALAALGHQVLAELASRAIGEAKGGPDDIEAIGPCLRPTASERAVLAKLVIPSNVGSDRTAEMRFGCVERNGIVVDAAYDVPGKGHERGVWRVVRASSTSPSATVTTLVEHTGLSRMDFMEWANEVTVRTLVLADVDGDGARDAVIGTDTHEGGARHHDVAVTTWLSATARKVAGGTFSSWFAPVPGRSHAPFVFEVGDDRTDEVTLRCLQATGAIDVCPEVVPVRTLVRRAQIAHWFIDGHDYGAGQKVPDRELAASLLDELAISAPARAQLVASLPATTPAMRVGREVAHLVEPARLREHGEIVELIQPVDHRPDELAKLLGDEPCVPITAADTKRLVASVSTWVRAHDRAIVDARHDDCGTGHVCTWKTPSAPAITSACLDGSRGLVSATWHYDVGSTQLAREVVFAVTGSTVASLLEASSSGWAGVCSECGNQVPGGQLDTTMYRHGDHVLAVVVDASPSFNASGTRTNVESTVSAIVDGVVGPAPPAHAQRLQFRPEASYAIDAIEIPEPKGTTVMHFDGAWHYLITLVPRDHATLPPSQPAARYVWTDYQRLMASYSLGSFDAADWTARRATRDALHHALVAYGADAAVIARIDAEAGAVK